jgi:hypothetical protein
VVTSGYMVHSEGFVTGSCRYVCCGGNYATGNCVRSKYSSYVFINNQQMHFLTVLLLHSITPTCLDTRVSSSASFSVPAELHYKHENIMVSSGQ